MVLFVGVGVGVDEVVVSGKMLLLSPSTSPNILSPKPQNNKKWG